MASADLFDEHLSVISALRDNYARKEDVNSVAAVGSMQAEIAQLCSGREEDVKQAIRDLTRQVRETEIRASYPEGEVPHRVCVDRLAEATLAARESVAAMGDTLQQLHAQRRALKERFKELRQKSAHIEQIVTEAEPHTRHQLSLYAHVSKVTWQFDAGSEHVAGAVSDPATGDIRKFDFDAADTHNFDIVNQLWSLMDAASAERQ